MSDERQVTATTECPYDTDDDVCRFCSGEDCGHPDCVGTLGRCGHCCEHDSWERHPDGAWVNGEWRTLTNGSDGAGDES